MTSPVRVVQIGCGHWGKNLARNFAQLGALVGVVDGDAATAERIAAEHGVPVTGLEAALADHSVDGIALATPATTHARLATLALEAGKHVFVEKPLALSPAEAEPVLRAAQKAGRVLMVGHLLQYHPIFLHLKALVEGGELGPLRYIYSNRLSLGKLRTEENVLWSFAPHDLSMILALAGEEPAAVDASGAAFVTAGIADWATCHLQFPSGLRGHVQVSWMHPFKEQRLVVVGEQATAVFEDSQPDWAKRLALYRHRVDRGGSMPELVKADAEYVIVESAEPLRSECQHFLDAIASGSQPRTDGAEGLRVLAVLDQAERALAESLK